MNIRSAYKKVISELIDCYLAGEFDANHLANEILSVPPPEEDDELEKEKLVKYYKWLIKELDSKEVKNEHSYFRKCRV
ncbi:hypothetical protein ES705_20254 [subsurface metagenome]